MLLRSSLPEMNAWPIAIILPIQWGDMDAFGHVNNTVHFRWYESARIAYLDDAGLGDMMTGAGIGPILASIRCDYRRQVTYPDTVHVGARVERIGRTSIAMSHAAWSEAQGVIVAEGDSTLVSFDYQAQRPTPVPDNVRAAIAKIEGREFST